MNIKTYSILNIEPTWKTTIFNITGVTQQHCAYIDLYTREYGAVFSRHSLQDRRDQFVAMATFRSRYQLMKVQLQILDTKHFQPLKEYKNTELK